MGRQAVANHFVDLIRTMMDHEPDAGLSLVTSDTLRDLCPFAAKQPFATGIPSPGYGRALLLPGCPGLLGFWGEDSMLNTSVADKWGGRQWAFSDFEFCANPHIYGEAPETIADWLVDTQREAGLAGKVPIMIFEANPYWELDQAANRSSFDGVVYQQDPAYPGLNPDPNPKFDDPWNRLWAVATPSGTLNPAPTPGPYQIREERLGRTIPPSAGCYRSTFDKEVTYLDQPDRYARWTSWFERMERECRPRQVGYAPWILSNTRMSYLDELPEESIYTIPNLYPANYPQQFIHKRWDSWWGFLLDEPNMHRFFTEQFACSWGIGNPAITTPTPAPTPVPVPTILPCTPVPSPSPTASPSPTP